MRSLKRFRFALGFLVCFAIVSAFDFYLLHALTTWDPETGRVDRSFETDDWYTLLRNMGFIGTWVILALGFWLHDRRTEIRLDRAVPIVVAPLLSGLAAEVLKLVFTRERPVSNSIIQEGGYHFRIPFSGFVDGSNLGLPSSHTAVAFGGCLMLAYFAPRLRLLLVILALGCGYSRMITGAHFASDVFLGGLVGWWIASWIGSTIPKTDRKFTLWA